MVYCLGIKALSYSELVILMRLFVAITAMKKCRDCSRDWQSLRNFYDMVFDLQFLLQCLPMLNRYNPNRQMTISTTIIENAAHFYNHFYRLAIPFSITISIHTNSTAISTVERTLTARILQQSLLQ